MGSKLAKKLASADEAVENIVSTSRIVVPPGCARPTELLRALARRAPNLERVELLAGMQIGESCLATAELSRAFRYRTWHVTKTVREAVRQERADFIPLRYSDVPRFLGEEKPDVALIHVSPPDRDGYLSLGINVSYQQAAVRAARMVIAQVNDSMPRTFGNTLVHESQIDVLVEVSEPLATYREAPFSATSERIAENVAQLIPKGATLQAGIGSIPERVLALLAEYAPKRSLTIVGLGTDAVVRLHDAGVLRRDRGSALKASELLGSEAVFGFAAQNPLVTLHEPSITHNVAYLGSLPRFVSLNSALQVDLSGQVNAEAADGVQVSAVGGSLDFVEAAWRSEGGRSIVALPAKDPRTGNSRIVASLGQHTPVTVPRYLTQTVATEHGIAKLSGKSVAERAAELIRVAAPEVREQLWEEFHHLTGSAPRSATT
jgi:acyl-CoA hydrolase